MRAGWHVPGLVVLVLAGTACAQASQAGPSQPTAPSSASTPTARPGAIEHGLFAVQTGEYDAAGGHGTITILNRNGDVRASQAFQLPIGPALACGEGGYPQHPATVANGAVYYLDTSGAVRRLSSSGAPNVVTHFAPRSSQQVTWFAVSSDGQRLMATQLTYPPISTPASPSQGCASHQPGPVKLTLESATTGGEPQTIFTRTLSTSGDVIPERGAIALMGWDKAGPVATVDTSLMGIGAAPGQIWTGPAAHLSASGQPGPPLGGSTCAPLYGEAADGAVLCYSQTQPTIRAQDGSLLWTLKSVTADFEYGDTYLSPSGKRAAFTLYGAGNNYDSSVMRDRDGKRVQLPAGFVPQGWLDEDTIVGAQGILKQGQLQFPYTVTIVNIANGAQPRALGLSGSPISFVGVLAP